MSLSIKYEKQLKEILQQESAQDPNECVIAEVKHYWADPTAQDPSYFGLVGTKAEVLSKLEDVYSAINLDNPSWHQADQTGAVDPKIQLLVMSFDGICYGVFMCADSELTPTEETLIKTALGITQITKRSDNVYVLR